VADFLALEERQIRANFGITGVRLWYELQGVPAITTVSRGEGELGQKSILHSRSFKTTTTDISVLHDAVAYHVREAAKELRGLGMVAGSFQVYLGTSRHGDFLLKGGSKQVFLTPPTADSFVLLKEAKRLTEALFEPGVPYKKAGVLLTDFTPEQYRLTSLFQEERTIKTEALTKAIDVINRSLTSGSKVLLGTHLKQAVWESSSVNKSPAYTTSWKDIKTVKA
jgi:DNA polymerase V